MKLNEGEYRKMANFWKKHILFIFMVAASLVLASCQGQGGAGTNSTPTPNPAPSPEAPQQNTENNINDNDDDINESADVNEYTDLNEDSLATSMTMELIPGSLANQIGSPQAGEKFAIMHTNFGEIHLRLFPELAPMAVENFKTHAENGFYEGVIFHRVIENFMIQSGDPLGTGRGGQSIWGVPFGDEFSPNLRHISGALSMANAGPATNGSQFFIVQNSSLDAFTAAEMENTLGMKYVLVDNSNFTYGEIFPSEFEFLEHYLQYGGTPHLDFGHTVFGQVFMGMDVVDAIAAVPVDANSRPVEEVIIERIEILPFGS